MQKEFVRVVELFRPSRFIGVNLSWNGKVREKSCRRNTPKSKAQKKRGRKSKILN
ncbi:MAG: hypothetical protein WCV67_15335 [Victivallaceae bacterium]